MKEPSGPAVRQDHRRIERQVIQYPEHWGIHLEQTTNTEKIGSTLSRLRRKVKIDKRRRKGLDAMAFRYRVEKERLCGTSSTP